MKAYLILGLVVLAGCAFDDNNAASDRDQAYYTRPSADYERPYYGHSRDREGWGERRRDDERPRWRGRYSEED